MAGEYIFTEIEAPDDLHLDYTQTVVPPKKYLLPSMKKWPASILDGSVIAPVLDAPPTVILGIHTCDLYALQLLFNAGRLRANVHYNEALALEAALRYQQTLQQAFREVSDAHVDVRKRREFREQQELLVNALADASQVATLRYEGGVASYLEVLDTERQLFDAERDLVQARRDESASVIQLYKALGGGWQVDAAPAAVSAAAPAATASVTPQ